MIDTLQSLVLLKPDILYHLLKTLLINTAQYLHMPYHCLLIDNQQVKVNNQYAIFILEVITTLLNLRNLLKPY